MLIFGPFRKAEIRSRILSSTLYPCHENGLVLLSKIRTGEIQPNEIKQPNWNDSLKRDQFSDFRKQRIATGQYFAWMRAICGSPCLVDCPLRDHGELNFRQIARHDLDSASAGRFAGELTSGPDSRRPGKHQRRVRCQLLSYAKFSARLNVPRSFWIFSCSSVMA
jgi:hypothetical protein